MRVEAIVTLGLSEWCALTFSNLLQITNVYAKIMYYTLKIQIILEENMSIEILVNMILCILSFILAAISVVTVAVTLRQNNRMIEKSTRPYISVYTDEINTGNPLFYLIIKNFGKSPAYITKFESDFDFRGCYKIPTDKDYLGNLKMLSLHQDNQGYVCSTMRKLEKKLLSLWNTILEQKRNIQKSLPLI